jgi:hypothetical protein
VNTQFENPYMEKPDSFCKTGATISSVTPSISTNVLRIHVTYQTSVAVDISYIFMH